jgi:hypothetical protein
MNFYYPTRERCKRKVSCLVTTIELFLTNVDDSAEAAVEEETSQETDVTKISKFAYPYWKEFLLLLSRASKLLVRERGVTFIRAAQTMVKDCNLFAMAI